jgi:hypothetical protein
MDGRSIRRLFVLRVQPADEEAITQPLNETLAFIKASVFCILSNGRIHAGHQIKGMEK